MIAGMGVDLMRRDRLERLPADAPFFNRVFTRAERNQAKTRADERAYYATRFAGKEAVFKALRGNPDVHRLEDIEILADEVGAPHVRLSGGMAQRAHELGVRKVFVSLSFETDTVLACAVAETEAHPESFPPTLGDTK